MKQRGEEFSPADLEISQKLSNLTDPQTGEEFLVQPADYLFGLNKLLDALEQINGQTTLDKRGELRTQFYLDLRRKPAERVSEYATRFRSLVADLKSEGVVLPSSELGWFFREKLGLDPLRKQLLDTALQAKKIMLTLRRRLCDCSRIFTLLIHSIASWVMVANLSSLSARCFSRLLRLCPRLPLRPQV